MRDLRRAATGRRRICSRSCPSASPVCAPISAKSLAGYRTWVHLDSPDPSPTFAAVAGERLRGQAARLREQPGRDLVAFRQQSVS